MKKNMIIAFVCFVMALSLCACSDSGASSAANTGSAEAVENSSAENSGRNVTFVLKNLINPFCVTVKEGAEQAGKDHNLNLTILTPVQGDNNEELMQLVEQAVASGECDTLVVFPSDSIGIVPAVQKAYDAGIPVVILNTAITSRILPRPVQKG